MNAKFLHLGNRCIYSLLVTRYYDFKFFALFNYGKNNLSMLKLIVQRNIYITSDFDLVYDEHIEYLYRKYYLKIIMHNMTIFKIYNFCYTSFCDLLTPFTYLSKCTHWKSILKAIRAAVFCGERTIIYALRYFNK